MIVPSISQWSGRESREAGVTWAKFLEGVLEPNWRPKEWDPVGMKFDGDLASQMTYLHVCIRPGCNIVFESAPPLCSGCRKIKTRLKEDTELSPRKPLPEDFDNRMAARFSLAGIPPSLRNEILYGLQDRDRQGLALKPRTTQMMIDLIPEGTESILEIDARRFPKVKRGLVRFIQQSIKRLKLIHSGHDGTEGDIWDCALVGLISQRDRNYRAVTGELDFTPIRQEWLREIVKGVLRSLRPSVASCQQYIRVATIASGTLSERPNEFRLQKLGADDMAAIAQGIASAKSQKDGKQYSEAHKAGLMGYWRRLIEHGRRLGLMEEVSGKFSTERIPESIVSRRSEDLSSRVIPEEWIEHFDNQIDLLGSTSNYAPHGWRPEDLEAMYQVFYKLLRDTGRRPSEIARLPLDPLEYLRGEPTLVYDNQKAGRAGRRLPIHKSTALVIENWRQHLESIWVPPECAEFLFPAPGARNRERRGHMSSSQFRRAFKKWMQILPEPVDLSPEVQGLNPLDFDPYGFRHSYAQRHADSGTPVDVLRELMDHREIDTTMGYYQVSLKRKQKAVTTLSGLTLDRDGNAAPLEDGPAYERSSVATPYGNCTEPSNVKAGGKSCPIRFQCGGCSFFRPDPSYIPAIEQQISQLRADRAIAVASSAKKWVIENFDAQISSYTDIMNSLNKLLEERPEEEREAILSASTDLRKARQLSITPVRK